MPVAEETGLIVRLGELALFQACTQLPDLQPLDNKNYTVAVNLSARQFRDKNLVTMVKITLEQTVHDPRWPELEIAGC